MFPQPQPPPPVFPGISFETRQAVIDSSVKLFAHMQNNQLTQAVVQVSPEHMGPIQARMDFSNPQAISISLDISNRQAFEQIQDQLQGLQQSLHAIGLQTEKIQVQHDPYMRQFIQSVPDPSVVPSSSSAASSSFQSHQQQQQQQQPSYATQNPWYTSSQEAPSDEPRNRPPTSSHQFDSYA